MGKRIKLKKQIDSFTDAKDLEDSSKKEKFSKFSPQETNKRKRSIEKEMVRKIKGIFDVEGDGESDQDKKHTNKVIYTIRPVE